MSRTRPVALSTSVLAAVLAVAEPATLSAAPLDLPVWRPGSPHRPVPAYLGDRLSLRLAPAAARLARAQAASLPPPETRPGRPRARALGVPGLDRTLAALGAEIAPEFRGESPPTAGDATDFTAFYLVHLPSQVPLETALGALRALPEVREANPIGVVPVTAVPDDSLWAISWYFQQPSRLDIHAPEAWDVTRGDTSVVVAILDTGVLAYHPDLAGTDGGRGQMWTNWTEAAGAPGVDDDANGFVDDVSGWDFVDLPSGIPITPGEDWRDEDGDPNDYVGHGTLVAGILGALSDNRIGVTGAAWKLRILPVRVGWSEIEQQTGVVDMAYLAQAIRYATRMGADVINISLSSTSLIELDLALRDALQAGITVVIAAGNNGSPVGFGDRVGPIYVTSTDREDRVTPWANRASYVDLAAPGAELATTTLRRPGSDSIGVRQPHYVNSVNGTSFSAPLAAGTVALMQAARRQDGLPDLDPDLAGYLMTATADDISASNSGGGYGSGRLNAARAVEAGRRIRFRATAAGAAGPMLMVRTIAGQRRLVSVDLAGRLSQWDAESLEFLGSTVLGARPTSGLAAADLGGGRGLGMFVGLEVSQVGGFGGGGSPLPGWPVTVPFWATFHSVALGDLDADGAVEIVAASVEGAVCAWRTSGELLPGFPKIVAGVAATAPVALSDLDGIPGVEIVVVETSSQVHAFRFDGSLVPGWSESCRQSVNPTGPVVAANALGQPLVLVGDAAGMSGFTSQGDCQFRVTTSGTPQSPALADLDGDGVHEVVIASAEGAWAFDLSGASQPGVWPARPDAAWRGAPLLADLTGDGVCEILLPDSLGFVALSATGQRIADFPFLGPAGPFSLLHPDDDPSGTWTVATLAPGKLVSFPGLAGSLAGAWAEPRGNPARTGSGLYAPAAGLADVEGPARISGLQAQVLSATSVMLRWTAPADDHGPAAPLDYEVAVAAPDQPPTWRYSLGATAPVGAAESLLVQGLPEDDPWTFTVRSRDFSGNWSTLSDPVGVTLPTRRPTAIEDLIATGVTDSSISLQWTATGEDGRLGRPVRYVILAHADVELHWSHPALAEAGGIERFEAGPVLRDTRYVFYVRAVDRESLLSLPSNALVITIGDTLPPSVQDRSALSPARNPARAPVSLLWSLPAGSGAPEIRILDLTGRVRRSLPLTGPGQGAAIWDGRDDGGRPVAPGLYFAVLIRGGVVEARARIALLSP